MNRRCRVLAAALLMTPLAAAAEMAGGGLADLVVIEKARRTLTLYSQGRKLVSYKVALGKNPVGPKRCEGDNRTPEGFYEVVGRKENSDFHRALRLSYPTPEDVERARRLGCEPGGDIMIHGLSANGRPSRRPQRPEDWTRGCVAVTNEEIEEIWELVPDGARVEIRP